MIKPLREARLAKAISAASNDWLKSIQKYRYHLSCQQRAIITIIRQLNRSRSNFHDHSPCFIFSSQYFHPVISDLHTHSTASDGRLPPVELLLRAEANGVSRLAVTDHDTVAGVAEIQRQLADGQLNSSVELVPGVEVTTQVGKGWAHIVGLWVDTSSSSLKTFLDGQIQVRERRGRDIGEALRKNGICDAYEGAKQIAGSAALSRPHFARFLVEQNHCTNEQQAFRRWLGAGKAGDVRCKWPELEQVVEAIHSAGGYTVLAHPDKYRLTRTRLTQLIESFCAVGGDAIELISGAQSDDITRNLLSLADKYGLHSSTGSDFHSPAQLWCDVGRQPELPASANPVWNLVD